MSIHSKGSDSKISDFSRKGNEIIFTSAEGDMKLEFCSNNMFRIIKSCDKKFPENEKWIVVKYEWEKVRLSIEKQNDHTILRTEELKIDVYSSPFRIEVNDKNGELLYSEFPKKSFYGDTVSVSCQLKNDEHFFGFGERTDFLDQRGKKIYLNCELGKGSKPAVGGKDILRANYCPVPFFMSTKGYGIFLHTAFPSQWDMGWSNIKEYTYKAFGGNLDYYFIYGPDFYSMIDQYTSLTGKSPLIPKTAFGLHVGTYSGGTWSNEQYTSDLYPVDLCRRMRKEGIPFDLLWLDSTWRLFNKGNGRTSFEWRETFKNPQAMIDSIYGMNVSMIGLHIRSIIDNGKNLHLFDEAVANNAVFPNPNAEGLINFFDQKAVDWWWDNAVMKIASMGIKFVKTDCGGVLRLNSDQPGYLGMKPAELHNVYPLVYAEAPYKKFQEYNNMRGFNHTREGYAGIQRTPFIWAGDWGSEWQWFEPMIRCGLNIGMSGVGYWSHCMGGFEQYSPHDTDLYVRWVQFGMFSPISILFGMDHPRYHEPWTYGKEAMANFIKYDSLRYTLIPYIYSHAYQLYKSGRPIMTPLVMDYQNDENVYRISDQYMFGNGMMICPVTTKGALSRPVYFPGGEWFIYETGERISGRQYKSFLTPLDYLPIFIKGGAIIPTQPAMQYMDEKPVNKITLEVFPSGKSTFDMYEDDGISLDYQKGVFSITHIESDLNPSNWVLTIKEPEGLYKPSKHSYTVKAYLGKEPSGITENGKTLKRYENINDLSTNYGWYFDESSNQVRIQTQNFNDNTIVLKCNI